MAGIVSYGAYVPYWRLQRSAITASLGSGGGKGLRSVASYDEDTTSMGVEACRNAMAMALRERTTEVAVLKAIGDDWDPVEVLAQEDRAYAMLYSNLDDDQQRIYDDLVAAGVLPDRVAGRVAD